MQGLLSVSTSMAVEISTRRSDRLLEGRKYEEDTGEISLGRLRRREVTDYQQASYRPDLRLKVSPKTS